MTDHDWQDGGVLDVNPPITLVRCARCGATVQTQGETMVVEGDNVTIIEGTLSPVGCSAA